MSEGQLCEEKGVSIVTENISEPITEQTVIEQLPTSDVIEEITDTKLETLEDATASRKQYLIVTANGTTLGEFQTVDNDVREPPTKLFKIEGEDGQSYVLTVAEDQTLQEVSKEEAAQLQKGIPPDMINAARGIEKRNLLGSDVSQAWFTTRDDKNMLHSKGASWRQGQWTKDEVELLQQNINEYCKDYSIGDPTEIIFEMCKDERKDFYRTIARGLQRPLFSVYRRVTRMYDQKNHMGKYSADEMVKLKEFRAKHGNDWAAIGAALGRSASSVKDKCRLMKDTCNSGKWLPEEERRLATAVYELSGVQPGENVTQGLSWSYVAERVITRSEKQCRTKWLNYLNWKQRSGTDWTREDDMNLIIKVSNLQVSDDTEIDWKELSKGWDSVRSPQWLRGKWWSLKRHIPDYQLLPFPDLLEYMKTFHLHNVRVRSQPGHAVSTVQQVKVDELPMTYIPVALTGLQMDSDLDENSSAVQAYEVLQQLPTSSGSFIITQPHDSPSVAMTVGGTTLPSDHIIVQAQVVPVSQESEDSTQQLNQQVVMTPTSSVTRVVSLEGTDLGTTIQLSSDISQTEQVDLGALAGPEECVIPEASEQLATDQSTFSTHTMAVEGVVGGEGGVVLGHQSELSSNSRDPAVLVTSSFAQSSSNDGELMSSFSDPMLNSDGNTLIGATSDVEGDKSTTDDPDLQVTVECKEIYKHGLV